MELPEKTAWLCHGLGDSHKPITSEGKFDDRETHVMFVMDKLVPGQVFLWAVQFYSASIIPPMAHTHYLIHQQWHYLLLAIEVIE